jgi:hypothetical protein
VQQVLFGGVADIAPEDGKLTPFAIVVLEGKKLDVLQWMVQQPECPVEAFVRDKLTHCTVTLAVKKILLEAVAQRQQQKSR